MNIQNNKIEIPGTARKIFTPVFIVLFFVSVIMLLLVYHTMSTHNGTKEIDTIKKVPEFSLTDQNGAGLTREDLLGTYWVANFIFTNCGGICPTMSFQMRALQNSIPADLPVHLVSISVDPERDTPAVLKEYAAEWNADPERWSFLTGEKEAIYSLAREGFLLGVNPEGGTLVEPIMHSQRFVLVDEEGMIRGYYDGFDDEKTGVLLDDLFYLLGEAR